MTKKPTRNIAHHLARSQLTGKRKSSYMEIYHQRTIPIRSLERIPTPYPYSGGGNAYSMARTRRSARIRELEQKRRDALKRIKLS